MVVSIRQLVVRLVNDLFLIRGVVISAYELSKTPSDLEKHSNLLFFFLRKETGFFLKKSE